MTDDELVDALIHQAQLNNEMDNTKGLQRAREKLMTRVKQLRDKAWMYAELSK